MKKFATRAVRKMDHLIRERPFSFALVVLLVIVLPGFYRLEQTVNEVERVASQTSEVASQTSEQADSNTMLVGCLIDYATKEHEALLDRDAVNHTTRAAAREMWRKIDRWLTTPSSDIAPMMRAIDRYRGILRRLDTTAALDPYPNLEDCLGPRVSIKDGVVVFTPIAYHPGRPCMGRNHTILGTSGSDNLHGTDGPDVIRSRGGNDLIIAGGGNDRICAGPGNDTINGGSDFDRARGRKGLDFCIQVEKPHSCS